MKLPIKSPLSSRLGNENPVFSLVLDLFWPLTATLFTHLVLTLENLSVNYSNNNLSMCNFCGSKWKVNVSIQFLVASRDRCKKLLLAQKWAFIEKSTIFTQSLWNSVKIANSWVDKIALISTWLSQNCIILGQSLF